MKIAILTGHNYNKSAIELVKKLSEMNVELSVVICINFKSLLRGIIGKMKNRELAEYTKDHISESLTGLSKKYNFKVFFSDDINSRRTETALKKVSPDVAIQSGVGIVKKHILEIPKIGILNAHMALLPKYRGMNVLEWSLFYGDPAGVTIHFIVEGIDTGDIVLKKELLVGKKDTIDSLRQKADSLSVDLFVEALQKIEHGSFQRVGQKAEEGKQYFVMHPRLKEYTELKLKLR